jgi:8-oxo-dGTP diphosphatase
MKRKGASIIFLNSRKQVLLLLRDDKPDIPSPGIWDLPGGHIDSGETPKECIVREMLEEIEMDVADCRPLSVYPFPDRTEYVFFLETDVEPEQITLHEGQMLRWFAESELPGLPLAYGFDRVLADFFIDCIC